MCGIVASQISHAADDSMRQFKFSFDAISFGFRIRIFPRVSAICEMDTSAVTTMYFFQFRRHEIDRTNLIPWLLIALSPFLLHGLSDAALINRM